MGSSRSLQGSIAEAMEKEKYSSFVSYHSPGPKRKGNFMINGKIVEVNQIEQSSRKDRLKLEIMEMVRDFDAEQWKEFWKMMKEAGLVGKA